MNVLNETAVNIAKAVSVLSKTNITPQNYIDWVECLLANPVPNYHLLLPHGGVDFEFAIQKCLPVEYYNKAKGYNILPDLVLHVANCTLSRSPLDFDAWFLQMI